MSCCNKAPSVTASSFEARDVRASGEETQTVCMKVWISWAETWVRGIIIIGLEIEPSSMDERSLMGAELREGGSIFRVS